MDLFHIETKVVLVCLFVRLCLFLLFNFFLTCLFLYGIMLKDISVAINKIHNIGAMAVTRLLFQ